MTTVLKMYNPELDAVGECTQEGYDNVYQFRGWELQSAVAARATEVLEYPTGNIENLTTDELRRIIAAQGLEQPDQKAKKAQLVKMVTDSVPGGDVEPAAVTPESPSDVAPPPAEDAGKTKEK